MRGVFTFKKELDFSSVLTALSILVSVAALVLALRNDRELRTREYADRIRHSTSVVTAKVERWRELSQRYFEDLEPAIVDASALVARTHDWDSANPGLYKDLMKEQAVASQRIVEEQLQISYMELYGYVPEVQVLFDATIRRIRNAERQSHDDLTLVLQCLLLCQAASKSTDRVDIGNKLRCVTTRYKAELSDDIATIAQPLREKMLGVIHQPDYVLADPVRRRAFTKDMAAASNEPAALNRPDFAGCGVQNCAGTLATCAGGGERHN